MKPSIRLFLSQKNFFGDLLADFGGLKATGFRFSSGVAAIRLENEVGSVVILPFQGQHIWSAAFDDSNGERRELTMKSMFDEPQPTREFLATFGGFLQHCGLLGAGGPGPTDTHPLHGEFPNAPFQKAWLVAGSDERGDFIGVSGEYRHTIAFSHNYSASPIVKVYAASSLFTVSMNVTNLKNTPMELMYLAHVNFRPVNGSHLVYTAQRTAEHVRVRTEVPSHIKPRPGYVEMLKEMAVDPTRHEQIVAGQVYDPEVVFLIDYLADGDGFAHTMQVHPDGSADYVRHRPDQLPRVTRWMCRTADQDSLAMAELGTCEPEGYTREKEKGNLKVLAPGETFSASFDCGVISAAEAQEVERKVNGVNGEGR
jgi:hypothetical protein